MKNAHIFDKYADADETFEIRIESLAGIKDIKENNWDLVEKRIFDKKKNVYKRVNIDYDEEYLSI